MPSCPICLGALKSPAAIPCGHIFCHECILRVVKAIKIYTPQHRCPVCREPYTVENADPKHVPDHLQLHVSPSIRKLHLNLFAPHDTSAEDCARYVAEIRSLRTQCNVLHWRSGVHSATADNLTCLAKMVRDEAIRMKSERDLFEQRYNALKRKVRDDDDHTAYSPSSSIATSRADRSCSVALASPVDSLDKQYTDSERPFSHKRMKREETSPLQTVVAI